MTFKAYATTSVAGRKEVSDTDEKYEKCLTKYTYLQEDKYVHKREQLYLMIQQGLSGKFVQSFFKDDMNITSLDLDFVRSLAVLCGEDFVIEHFYKKAFTFDEARQFLEEHIIARELRQRTEDLIREKEKSQDQFNLQIDFLKKERESMQSYYDKMLQQEVTICRQEAEIERVKMEHDKELITKRLESSLQENQQLQQQVKDAMEEIRNLQEKEVLEKVEEMKQHLTAGTEKMTHEKENHMWPLRNIWSRKKCRDEKELRNKYIIDTISNSEFSPEQLDVILEAVREGLSLEELQQLCVPRLPVRNMQLLKLFLLKRSSDDRGEE